MYVLGTAGHIDHGKSLLVQALTGIDPDRLREEKSRGMTIELGFAWLKLPSGREVSIVDVPGHERFVRHMLAGVGGIDVALLVVAANESVMPQTREHLAILDLIGVSRGIIVITKQDLVDEELLSLVRMEIEELIASTSLAGAPVVAVSAMTGAGLPELLSAIDKLLDDTEPRPDLGRPRLPIDRIFTMVGAGTVVTGTLIDGALSVGQEVEIVPSGLKSRLRGLQTHKSKIDTASPGSRVAANLVGVTTAQLQRGDVVTKPGWLQPTASLTVKLKLISYLKRPLRHGAEVSFHSLAAETMAKVRLLEGDELRPGDSTWAQLKLKESLAVIDGDRYIIRSPVETLGGGSVVDARARRLRRLRPDVIENLRVREGGTDEEMIMALLEAGPPLEFAALIVRSRLPADKINTVVASLVKTGKVVALGEGGRSVLLTASGWRRLADRAVAALTDYHKRFPARPGMPRVELSTRLKLGDFISMALDNFVKKDIIVLEGSYLRLPSHRVRLTTTQQAKVDAFLKSLAAHPYAPPSDLIPEPDLLNMLVEQERAVKVSDNVVFAAAVYRDMVTKITARIKENTKITLSEVRDMFGTSRKYAQALLEYLDREKVTRRVGDDRILY
jgi:selenocysteine-specific elongation factor